MAETAGAICGECRSMEGLVCVVTGATSGIGREIALGLARAGARVLGVGRSAERAALAEREIGRDAGRGEVRFTAADLSLQSSVAALAREAATRWGRVDVLVNNAGTFAARRALTPDGVELQLAVNYIAPFLLTRELLPHLARAPDGRVISLSSGSHFGARIEELEPARRGRYRGLATYGATKLAVTAWSFELARRLGPESRIRTFAVDPGLVNTDMGLKGTSPAVRLVWLLRRRGGISPAEGARTPVALARAADAAGLSGRYWKECRVVASSRESLDAGVAARAWALAEELTRVTAPAAVAAPSS